MVLRSLWARMARIVPSITPLEGPHPDCASCRLMTSTELIAELERRPTYELAAEYRRRVERLAYMTIRL